jgi:glycerophosphoryl diester phosphodiesterase
MVSAHAGHTDPAAPLTLDSYRAALAAGADLVEFDIRRTADAELVAAHDPTGPAGRQISAMTYGQLCDLAGSAVPRATDVFTLIKGRAKGHLDLKVTGGEDTVVGLALDILGPGEFIVTTPEDVSVAAIRSRFSDPDAVPVALSLGRGLTGVPRRLRTRASELWPLSRVRACGANWAAVNHRLAAAGVARQCRRHQLKVMVWTVNAERELRYWLAGERTDVLVTDRPALAVTLRSRVQPGRHGTG